MIKLKNVSVEREYELFSNITMELHKGKVYGLVGPNGCGKTTLLRCIVDLISYHGDIEKEDGRKCFYIESSKWFDPFLTGMDYINLYQKMWGSPEKIKKVVEYWEMSSFINKKIRTYSLGMKQRLLLSLYMFSESDYFLFDEPSSALDKKSVHLFYQYINHLKEREKLVVFSTHYQDDVLNLCDYVLEFNNPSISIKLNTPKNMEGEC